jgi:hypothetical protein
MLCEHQYVEPGQHHRVGMQEAGGKDPAGLRMQ